MLLLKKLLKKYSEFFMGSLDVESLFTNIALEETKSLATKESYLIFNGKLYKQVDGVAFRSIVCKCIFCILWKELNTKLYVWLVIAPHYDGQYVDDILVLLTSPKPLEAFWTFLNDWHDNFLFIFVNEKENKMSFLDIQINCKNKKITHEN